MIAVIEPSYSNDRRGFARRIHYACDKQSSGLVLNMRATWQEAIPRMERTALLLNSKVRKPEYHVILSWHGSEKINDAQMLEAGQMWLHKTGAGGHQAVLAVHPHSAQSHLHIIINRVHPITGEALKLWGNYKTAELACREIEQAFGWPQDRGRYDALEVDGKIVLQHKPKEHWDRKILARARGLRPSSRATRQSSLGLKLPFLRDSLAPEPRRNERAAADLRRMMTSAATWQDLHQRLAVVGLRYIRHRSGGRICDMLDPRHMAAGEIGSSCTLPRLEAELGPFEAALAIPAPRPAPRRKVQRKAPERELRAQLEQQQAVLASALAGSRSPGATILRQAFRITAKAQLKQARRARIKQIAARVTQDLRTAALLAGSLARRMLHSDALYNASGHRMLSTPIDYTMLRQIHRDIAPVHGAVALTCDPTSRFWIPIFNGPHLAGFVSPEAERYLAAAGAAPSVKLFARSLTEGSTVIPTPPQGHSRDATDADLWSAHPHPTPILPDDETSEAPDFT